MSGINKYEGKDRRRQRLRNHAAKDLRRSEFKRPERKRNEDENFLFDARQNGYGQLNDYIDE